MQAGKNKYVAGTILGNAEPRGISVQSTRNNATDCAIIAANIPHFYDILRNDFAGYDESERES